MMSRSYIGLDIGTSALRAVVLHKKKGTFSVSRCRAVPFPTSKILPSALTEENIFDKKILKGALGSLMDSFSDGEERISLTLPESAGRLVLTEIDARFKSKKEGREFLRWRLKKLFSLDPNDIHLDYQVLQKSTGPQHILVSIISRRTVELLEETFSEAGFFISIIDFHALSCFNYYHPLFQGENNFCFICCEDGILNFFYFADRMLSYLRSRSLADNDGSLFHEIQRSVIDCRNSYGDILTHPLFFHAGGNLDTRLFSFLNSFFSGRTVFLESGLENRFNRETGRPPRASQALVAAVGAAKRLMADR